MQIATNTITRITLIILLNCLLTGTIEGQRKKLNPYTDEKGKLACLHCSQNYGGIQHITVNELRVNTYHCLQIIQNSPHKILPVLVDAVKELETNGKKNTPRYADYQLKLGRTYQVIGDIERARNHFMESLEISEACFGAESWFYGNFCADAGRFFREIRDYEMATIYTNRVLAINKKLKPNDSSYFFRLVGLGHLYRLQGDLVKAEEILKTAYEGFKERNYNNRYAKREMCYLYFQIGEYEKALEILNTLKFKYNLHWTYEDQIFTYAKTFDALNELQKSKDYWLKVGAHFMEKAKIFDNLSERDQVRFLKSFQKGFSQIQSFALRNPQFAEIAKLCYNQQLKMKELILNNRKSWHQVIQNSLDENLKTTFEEWKSLKKRLGKEYGLAPNKRSVDFNEMVQKVNDLENRLANASALFQTAIQVPKWKDIQDRLTSHEVVIEFAHFKYAEVGAMEVSQKVQYVAYVLQKKNATPIIVPLFEEKELGNVKRTQTLYAYPNNSNTANLHQLLYQKLEAQVNGIEKIYFSPSGKLHRLNFGAIPVNEMETIAERFQIHQMGSTRNIIQNNNDISNATENALVIGGVEYNLENSPLAINKNSRPSNEPSLSIPRALRGTEWDYLEWTEKEASAIQNILQNNKINTNLNSGINATEEAFKTIGVTTKSPEILHIATHGYFFSRPKANAKTGFQAAENPLIRSGLILAGANYAWKGGQVPFENEDGILTAYEIAQMDLSNTEIVVLSACKTGLGDIESSEGIFGLQRAFKMAGVKYVLMSLWSVDDKKTYEFMTKFYENWKETGKSVPQSYQSAQNEMKQRYAKEYGAHAWAGFVLSE